MTQWYYNIRTHEAEEGKVACFELDGPSDSREDARTREIIAERKWAEDDAERLVHGVDARCRPRGADRAPDRQTDRAGPDRTRPSFGRQGRVEMVRRHSPPRRGGCAPNTGRVSLRIGQSFPGRRRSVHRVLVLRGRVLIRGSTMYSCGVSKHR
jgi:hypothetical protein